MKYGDSIDRQAAIDAINKNRDSVFHDSVHYEDAVYDISNLPSAQPGWIPFKLRPVTEEEKEEHPDWEYILDCKLPDDGQRILVNIKYRGHEAVQMDEYFDDDGCYLDSGVRNRYRSDCMDATTGTVQGGTGWMMQTIKTQ